MAELRLAWMRGFDDADEQRLIAGEDNPYDSDGRLVFRDKDEHAVLLDAADTIVAAAGLCAATAQVAGAAVPVTGLGGVIVRADHRGRGLARRLVAAALARAAAAGDAEFMLLFCWSSRADLYARLGFAAVAAPVVVAQPGGRWMTMHMETMWRGLRPGTEWPPGAVTLTDLPF